LTLSRRLHAVSRRYCWRGIILWLRRRD